MEHSGLKEIAYYSVKFGFFQNWHTMLKQGQKKKIHFIKQLLDEVEHDSDNYQGQSLSYLPKPKAEADNTN